MASNAAHNSPVPARGHGALTLSGSPYSPLPEGEVGAQQAAPGEGGAAPFTLKTPKRHLTYRAPAETPSWPR
jgi:hypothetical protein